ncbi:MAG: amino acid ABC transporter permease [Clostridia bacterium]
MPLLTNIATWFDGVKAEFILNFVEKDRWRLLWEGLQNTLIIALFACLIGIVIGVIIAIIRTTWDNTKLTTRKGFGRSLLAFLNGFARVYTTIIRGTPVVIQLMIMYYVIFASSDNGVMVAILAFGLNSGAYVSEIFRGGILSVDKGQMEAGRSLGLGYLQTMGSVIAPQVLKNVLPTLANEFIALLKETSVAGYVAVADLTFGGNRIRGVTYSAFMPLIAVALIYLAVVMFFTWLVGKLERRLRQGDNR